MTQTKISYEEFMTTCNEISQEYGSKQKDYGWACKSYTEALGETYYYYMTNRFQTTKIMYIASAKIMEITHIYSKDLEIMNKLKETL